MDLLKITQKFEMTQQIRTISRANGLRRLTTIIAYHNRGNRCPRIDRASLPDLSILEKTPSTILPMVPKESFASRGSRFSITVFRLTHAKHTRARTCTFFLLINLLLHKYVSLAAQRNILRRRVSSLL